jgi:hypothetical protein
LLFVTLDAVWGTNVVTENPSFVDWGAAREGIGGATCKKR